MSETFDAYVLEEQGLRQLSEQDLPAAEVTVDVSHSSLKDKDGLPDLAGQILAGQVSGRVLIEIGR